MSVLIHLPEMRALVRMLEHEHFAYGEDGVLALNCFRKVEKSAEDGQELTSNADVVHLQSWKQNAAASLLKWHAVGDALIAREDITMTPGADVPTVLHEHVSRPPAPRDPLLLEVAGLLALLSQGRMPPNLQAQAAALLDKVAMPLVAAKQEEEAAKLLTRLRERGCPTYLCRDGSRTRDGALLCVYCDGHSNGAEDIAHADDCVWLALLEITGP